AGAPQAAPALSLSFLHSRRRQTVSAAGDRELAAAVACPGGLVAARIERAVLAHRLRCEAACTDAEAREVVPHGVRAAQAEREVVLDRAALVGVARDAQCDVRV